MGCTKQLSIAAAASDQFTPLNSAVYVPSTQEILGTCENYVCRFNASTGAYINQVKVLSPIFGPMGIGLVNNLPFISAWNEKYQMNNATAHLLRDIFPIDATTLIAGIGLGWNTKFEPLSTRQWVGPGCLLGVGNRVYAYEQVYGGGINFIDTVTPATYGTSGYMGDIIQNIGSDGTFIYMPRGNAEEIQYTDLNCNLVAFVNTPTHRAVATEWVDHSNPAYKRCYAVCGTKWMIRVDDFGTDTKSYIDLDALTGQTDVNPSRIRFNPTDDLVYMPCQNKNAVIVYDPVAGTATWKTGFDSPVDVVFSLLLSGKKFAVQSGLVGLKEIV